MIGNGNINNQSNGAATSRSGSEAEPKLTLGENAGIIIAAGLTAGLLCIACSGVAIIIALNNLPK